MTPDSSVEPAAPRVVSTAYVAAGIGIAGGVLGASTFALMLAGEHKQSYPEFIVGALASFGKDKFADLWGLPIAMLAAMAIAAAAYRIIDELRGRDVGVASSFITQIIGWSLPAVAGFGSFFVRPFTDPALFHVSAAAIVTLVVATAFAARAGGAKPSVIGFALVAVALFALLPFEIAVAWTRLATRLNESPFDPRSIALAIAVVGALGVVAICALVPHRLPAIASKLVIAASAGLPLFFALIYPARFIGRDGGLIQYATTRWLVAAIVVLLLWAWWDVGRRARDAWRRAGADIAGALSPIALFGLLIAIRYGDTLPPVVPADDFHFGEKLLGWWSALRFGALPYLDIVPLHGIVDDDLPGYLSALFFDGTAASLGQAEQLAYVALSLAAYLALRRATGSLALAFVATTMLGGRLAWLFLTPFFCLVADRSFESQPARWLIAWVVAVPIVILGVPPQGYVWVAASAPLVLWALVRIAKERQPLPKRAAAAGLVALAVLLVATPLASMLKGSLRYVLAYARVNQVAYGFPWDVSWQIDNKPFIAGEIVRMSWTIVPLLAAALALRHVRPSKRRARVLCATVPALIFMVLLIPYTMGRIEPGGVSRPGVAANLGWAALVPLMGAAAAPAFAWPVAAFAATLGASSLGVYPTAEALARVSALHPLHADLQGAVAAGLPAMGRGITVNAHRDRVRRLRDALDRRLAPHDPFLDLSGHNAIYFYLDRKSPLPIAAPYNLVPIREQQRAIERLDTAPPAIALLSGDNMDFDGGGVALRTPLLFRYVLKNYEPFAEDGFVFGRLRARGVAPPSRTAEELALFDGLSAPRHLAWIAVSWGRSQASLEERMERVAALDGTPQSTNDLQQWNGVQKVVGTDPHIYYDVSAHHVGPAQAGLLAFDFQCIGPRGRIKTNPPRLQVFWWGDAQQGPTEPASLYANAADGRLIVPLDAYARYLGLAALKGLRIDLDNADACTAIDIRNLALMQRRSVLDTKLR